MRGTGVEPTMVRLRDGGLRAWIVGGAVRDLLCGRALRDVDVVVEGGLDVARRLLPGATLIGSRPQVLALPGAPGRPRIEISDAGTGEHALEHNLSLRDFTLNAMALDPLDGRVVDPFGGREALRSRRLVAVDPEGGLRADPVRVLRGVRLARELDLHIEPGTERAMERDAWRLTRSPGERRRDELFRLLELERPSESIERLRALGALGAVLPELLRTVSVAQNRHHPDDVYRHTLRVVDGVRADPLLRLAALLHDVAKPDTKRWIPGRSDFSFLRHELRARFPVRRTAARLRLSRRQHRIVAGLVRHHLLLPERLGSDRAIRRMLARVGVDMLPLLLELRGADLGSRTRSGRPPAEWNRLLARIAPLAAPRSSTPAVRLQLRGGDVMRVLEIPEGPEVGRWLRRARRRIIERPEENDRDRLIVWLRRSAGVGESGGCTRP